MDVTTIRAVVLDVLRDVQAISGEDYLDIGVGDKPLGALDGFDSLKGIEATVMVEERLGREIERDSLFVSDDGRRATTLAEICDQLAEFAASAEKDVAVSRVAERLRLAREQAGLSQGQVARLLGKHRPTISEIEAGRRSVSAEELGVFADIYEVSATWLLEREGESTERRTTAFSWPRANWPSCDPTTWTASCTCWEP